MAFFDVVAEMLATQASRDNWAPSSYQAVGAFVPKLATKVLEWLDVQKDDRILDIGCGDGILTQGIASQLTDGRILGIDASAKMIEAARWPANFKDTPKEQLRYAVLDATTLLDVVEKNEVQKSKRKVEEGMEDEVGDMRPGEFTKIFSNAALHWILRKPETRVSVLKACHKLLEPGGSFVFEMGSQGNIAELHTALLSSTAHRIGIVAARAVDPWYFSSETWMRQTLEGVGFRVEKVEVEYRPTKAEEGEGGALEGWVKLMGRCFIEVVAQGGGDEEEMVKEIVETLETVCGREDGSSWMGYVRLRVKAVKPE